MQSKYPFHSIRFTCMGMGAKPKPISMKAMNFLRTGNCGSHRTFNKVTDENSGIQHW